MPYTWDEQKNVKNIRKHGIDFRDAVRIFEGELIEWIDRRLDYGEERWSAIGLLADKEVYVVYVEKNADEKRIISARAATRRERDIYWREFGR